MTLLAIAVLAVASIGIYVRVRLALRAALDSALLSIARTEVAGSIDEPGGAVHVHEEIPVPTSPVGSGYEKFALIKDEHHVVRAQTANLALLPPLETDSEREIQGMQGHVSFADMHRGDEIYRGIYYPAHDAEGRPLVAVVAISSRPLQRSLDSLIGALVFALTIGGVAAALGAQRVARRLTGPLEDIAEAADRIGGTNLQARIPEVSADNELVQVTRVLNEMLERLESTFSAQRRFMSDASHELRSPLANLRGTVEVALRRSRTAGEYQEALAVALAEAERLSRLVDELLMLSRVDSKQFTVQCAPCDLSEIARRAVVAVAARQQEAGVQVRLDAEAVPIAGDAHRLRQVVDNLLDNALRYAPAGSEVTVSSRCENGHAVLSVRDAGPGLSSIEQAHVFDRFYRADAARGRDSGGLGLGLPIAKAIVDAHHGTLTVHSSPGYGCTFTVRLPVESDAASHMGRAVGL
jgi:two-component system OmpR family sensor kinase